MLDSVFCHGDLSELGKLKIKEGISKLFSITASMIFVDSRKDFCIGIILRV